MARERCQKPAMNSNPDTMPRSTLRRLAGPWRTVPGRGLTGAICPPGDKSISHRALILGALANGKTQVTGLLKADDVLRTAAALRALGAEIEVNNGVWTIEGRAWRAPEKPLYLGNSGTGARLLAGAISGARLTATLDGDASLRSRPMGRVLEPLRLMGVVAQDQNGRLPASIDATNGVKPVDVRLAKPSAQVKSAILLAALGAQGRTLIHEPILCRDHTERMLGAFGGELAIDDDGAQGRFIKIDGQQTLTGASIVVPGDPSSAAFAAAAAVITPGSDIQINGVLRNETRDGFFATLREMGGNITTTNERISGGETVVDLRVRHSVLRGIEVPGVRTPSMIDEYPILSVVAAFAHGETKMHGLEELRVKESDRLAAVEAGLAAAGVETSSGDDWLMVRGTGAAPRGEAVIKTEHDHRIAMSFLIMGLATQRAVSIDDAAMIATSYPSFLEDLGGLGAQFESV